MLSKYRYTVSLGDRKSETGCPLWTPPGAGRMTSGGQGRGTRRESVFASFLTRQEQMLSDKY